MTRSNSGERRRGPRIYVPFPATMRGVSQTWAPFRCKIRWDITSVATSPSGETSINPGGTAFAFAEDGSRISLTGSGTFSPDRQYDVTGGGSWQTFDPTGSPTANGTYSVIQLINWSTALGRLPPSIIDTVGEASQVSTGLALLKVLYSDGRRGMVVVSSRLGGTSGKIFEGVTATKGNVDYWQRGAGAADANHTIFHRLIPCQEVCDEGCGASL